METTIPTDTGMYLLENGYYIEEIKTDRFSPNDYWLAKEGSEKRQFLSSNKSVAFEKANEIIRQ